MSEKKSEAELSILSLFFPKFTIQGISFNSRQKQVELPSQWWKHQNVELFQSDINLFQFNLFHNCCFFDAQFAIIVCIYLVLILFFFFYKAKKKKIFHILRNYFWCNPPIFFKKSKFITYMLTGISCKWFVLYLWEMKPENYFSMLFSDIFLKS